MPYRQSELREATTAFPCDLKLIHTRLHLHECQAVEPDGKLRCGCMDQGAGWNRATFLAQQPNGDGFSHSYIHKHTTVAEWNRVEGCGWHVNRERELRGIYADLVALEWP